MPKFYSIDPETCTIEALEAAIEECAQKVGYFGALEQGCKKFINSIYGALGSAFYACANTAIAESVTAQGKDLIKFATRRINYLVSVLLPKLNEVTHPNYLLVNKETNEVEYVVYYDSLPEVDQIFMDTHYGFICKKSIPLGYNAMTKQLYKNKELGLEQSTANFAGVPMDGTKFDLTLDNMKYVFDRLDPFKRIGYEMLDIDSAFDMDAYMGKVHERIEFPLKTRKIDPDTGDITDTFQVYGDTDSSYITFHPIVEAYEMSADIKTHFLVSFYSNIVADYLDLQFEKYASDFNCPKNLEAFELEKIARSLLMQKKKKYVMDISWKEPDVYVEPLHALVFKGVEVTKGESSHYVRKEQRDFVEWIMDNINKGNKLKYSDITKRMKAIKARFDVASPDDICKTVSLSDYEKYVLNDKGSVVLYADGVVVPQNAKSVSWYNNLLYTKFSRYRKKYDIIHKGDKVRLYYVEDPVDEAHETFAFSPGNFPREFAPKIDRSIQFEKLILDPLNRYVEALGYAPISAKLTYKKSFY